MSLELGERHFDRIEARAVRWQEEEPSSALLEDSLGFCALVAGDVVILDNLASHKSAKAEAILKQRGAWFLFLPPYSPDLNPIDMAFAKLKAHLRRIGARTIDALWKAIGDICALYTEQECWNYLKDAGYAPD